MKKKLATVLVVVVVLVLLSLVVKALVIDKQNASAALKVDSIPKAEVYINDTHVGQTPYEDDKMKPGEVKVRLTAAAGVVGTYAAWEGRVKLTELGLTYIDQQLAATNDLSGGQILWLAKLLSDKSAEVAISSDPDGANVAVDGLDSGRSSVVLSNLDVGDHEIIVSKAGYSDQVVHGKVIGGYRLNVVVKLSRLPDESSVTAPTATSSGTITPASLAMPKPYVIIRDTPTGFLNVRVAPDLTATLSGKVNPGEKYPLVSEQPGWVLLRQASSSANIGWVSDQYVEKFK